MTFDMKTIEQLKASKRIVGEISPMIIDWDGEILSGQHRSRAGWVRATRVDTRKLAEKWGVTPLMAKDMIRLHTNVQRRPSKKETQFLVRRMALCLKEMGVPEGQIAKELTKYVPYTLKYILELLPEKYKLKEKVEAAKAGVPVRLSRTEKSEAAVTPEITKPTVEAKVTRPPKSEETWEFRKARMSAPISRMDEAVLIEVQRLGEPVEFQREFCVQSTTPDLYFPKARLAVYLDGPVHEGREERDEALRDLLAKRYDVRVLSLRYEAFTDKAKQQILEEIKVALGEEASET